MIGVGVAFFLNGQAGGVAALYGGGVALANTLMLGRRVQRADHEVAENAQRGMIMLYISAVSRFVFILVALAVGLGALRLLPLPLVGNFVGAQLAFMLASVTVSRVA